MKLLKYMLNFSENTSKEKINLYASTASKIFENCESHILDLFFLNEATENEKIFKNSFLDTFFSFVERKEEQNYVLYSYFAQFFEIIFIKNPKTVF